MKNMIALFLFLILPISSIGLLFVTDSNPQRKLILNGLLILNAIVYLLPIAYAYFNTPKGGNMWDENGPGAVLWLYMILLPLCVIAQVVLLILKIVNKS
ncbi:hypothetical protein [Pseudozobellia thermophila]|uniref:Uncharacterized protein n=1 Tax=Pseudozobellia thermophila TaxID=192903 RepID=A0A1M6NR66_9FLAO|nr:hypothetical protein [Pseudozobellia thermophila]SHJ98231.1 hypothetical protein SAMN04488513_11511 [Pseudozobellia thermophila]